MLCGKWESFPREFAKCRRCRKAKYCGKECQSRAWSEGHRFWCSAREGEDAEGNNSGSTGNTNAGSSTSTTLQNPPTDAGGEWDNASSVTVTPGRATLDRIERRQARDRERQRMSSAAVAALSALQPAPSAGSAVATARNASTVSKHCLLT